MGVPLLPIRCTCNCVDVAAELLLLVVGLDVNRMEKKNITDTLESRKKLVVVRLALSAIYMSYLHLRASCVVVVMLMPFLNLFCRRGKLWRTF